MVRQHNDRGSSPLTRGRPLSFGRCGGPPGYAEYLDAIGDAAQPEHEHMRLVGARNSSTQRRRPKGARGHRQRIVRNLEATPAQAAMKIGVKRQSKGPLSYAYASSKPDDLTSDRVSALAALQAERKAWLLEHGMVRKEGRASASTGATARSLCPEGTACLRRTGYSVACEQACKRLSGSLFLGFDGV
ncbi:hypothetical protein ACVIHI_000043 [Bradyrhizobium sp. USDA 4524]|nr:hypothetical protein [Bradyrhizobium sp. USDA 4538]MCP1899158.1 hypothetical protein [Bradyrhizobium sp. USDA 4537]MCP1986729.1 hypothetical protein [Bradyrhizobium sp. USDA 4539]